MPPICYRSNSLPTLIAVSFSFGILENAKDFRPMKVQSTYYLVLYCLALIVLSEWGCQSHSSPIESVDAESLFVYEVLPLIESKCLSCHGEKPDELKGDFDMRTKKTLFAGGESGRRAVLPGQPEKSPLYLAATRVDPDFAMPPKEGDALSQRRHRHSLRLD